MGTERGCEWDGIDRRAAMLGLEASNSVLKRSFLSNYSPQYPISLKEIRTVLTIKTAVGTILSDSPFSLRASLKLKLTGDGTTTVEVGRFGIYKA